MEGVGLPLIANFRAAGSFRRNHAPPYCRHACRGFSEDNDFQVGLALVALIGGHAIGRLAAVVRHCHVHDGEALDAVSRFLGLAMGVVGSLSYFVRSRE